MSHTYSSKVMLLAAVFIAGCGSGGETDDDKSLTSTDNKISLNPENNSASLNPENNSPSLNPENNSPSLNPADGKEDGAGNINAGGTGTDAGNESAGLRNNDVRISSEGAAETRADISFSPQGSLGIFFTHHTIPSLSFSGDGSDGISFVKGSLDDGLTATYEVFGEEDNHIKTLSGTVDLMTSAEGWAASSFFSKHTFVKEGVLTLAFDGDTYSGQIISDSLTITIKPFRDENFYLPAAVGNSYFNSYFTDSTLSRSGINTNIKLDAIGSMENSSIISGCESSGEFKITNPHYKQFQIDFASLTGCDHSGSYGNTIADLRTYTHPSLFCTASRVTLFMHNANEALYVKELNGPCI